MTTEKNVSQLSEMALEASSEMVAIKKAPSAVERVAQLPSTREMIIDSTDNVDDVSMAEGGLSQDAILKSDTYFPININLPTAGGTGATSTPTVADEDSKRKKMIMIASIVLAVIVLVIVFMSFKKSK